MPREKKSSNDLAVEVAQRIGDLTGETLFPPLPVDGHPVDSDGRNWDTRARNPAERRIIDALRDEYDLGP